MAETLPKAAVAVEEQTPLLNEAIPAEDNAAQQFAENKPLETEPPSAEMAQLSTADHTNDTNEETVEETLVNELDLEDSEPAIPTEAELSQPQAEIPQDKPLEPQGESPDSAGTTLTVDTLNSPFQLKELEILMPSVKRFLLTGSVSNREPQGKLNEISFIADGSAAVCAYSEVVGKKGSRFKYVWLHDGNHIATIPVNVGSNRWRSYSSKVINRSMSGAWRVELQDGQGRLMASADFFLE